MFLVSGICTCVLLKGRVTFAEAPARVKHDCCCIVAGYTWHWRLLASHYGDSQCWVCARCPESGVSVWFDDFAFAFRLILVRKTALLQKTSIRLITIQIIGLSNSVCLQGIDLAVYLHESRALTEKKEKWIVGIRLLVAIPQISIWRVLMSMYLMFLTLFWFWCNT